MELCNRGLRLHAVTRLRRFAPEVDCERVVLMGDDDQVFNGALDGLDANKRTTLKRLIGTGAFVGPVLVSFTMADLSIDAFMHAAAANATTTTHPTTTTTTTTARPGTTTTTTTGAPGTTTTTTSTTRPPGHPAKS